MQAAFQDGTLAEECTWQAAVLVLNGRWDFHGIGLIEVLWKAIVSLINRQLMSEISFHNTLHRFWAGRGTKTAALEAKLLQQLTAMREAVIFEVFLDLWKVYYALDRE